MNRKNFEIIDLIRGDDIVIAFIDLSNFTKMIDLAVQVKSEKKIIRILNEFYKYSSSIIYKNNGIIDKFLGDGIMALYGSMFSNNYDLTPREYLLRAVESCLDILTFIQTLGENMGMKLNISSGVWSGEVFMGFSSHEEKTRDISVIGDPVNVASRLQKIAHDGEMIIPFIPDIDFKDNLDLIIRRYGMVKYYEKLEVRGKDKPVNVFRIIGERAYARNHV